MKNTCTASQYLPPSNITNVQSDKKKLVSGCSRYLPIPYRPLPRAIKHGVLSITTTYLLLFMELRQLLFLQQ